jgi:YVTN family beta-propeller protein
LGDGEVPVRLALTPDGKRAYVAGDGGDMWVIDLVNNEVADTVVISTSNPLSGVAVTPDGTRAYVGCGNNSTIFVLNTATNTVVDAIKRRDSLGGITIVAAK